MSEFKKQTGKKSQENLGVECIQAIALFNYVAEDNNDISLKKGDMLIIYDRHSSGWWTGNLPKEPPFIFYSNCFKRGM